MNPTFHLPKGTKVSHGTALANLLPILETGLQPSGSRHPLRDFTEEKPKALAVYVGGPGAYFGAWAASGALFKEYSMIEHQLPTLGPIAMDDPNELRNRDFVQPPLAIPIVLTIELQEDTLLVGDEDFVLSYQGADKQLIRLEADTDESIWSRFRSGGLVRDGGIPPSWITSMQFPQLLRTDSGADALFQQLARDCWQFAAGIAQNQQHLVADRVQLPDGPWTEASTLSQTRLFNPQSVHALLAMRHVADRANLLYNCIWQNHFVSAIGVDGFDINFVS